MNNNRRKDIKSILSRLANLQAEFEAIRDDVQSVAEAEREAFDAMPESLQEGERGQRASEAADALEEVHSDMDAIDFDDLTSRLETAAE